MKIDLHTHSYYSYDALCSPRKMLKAAQVKGLDGIAITDHDTTKGWDDAIKAAKGLNMLIVLGEEIKTKQGDVLGLFLTKEIKGKGEDAVKVIKEIKEQGGVAIIPHPFHYGQRFKEDLNKCKDLIDGIEVFNARLPFGGADKKALAYAQENNLTMTAGSDAHFYAGVGYAYTIVEGVSNLDEFKKGILAGQTKTKGSKAPLLYAAIPALAKIKNCFIKN